MNMKMALGFAKRNLKANKYLEIPFIMATGIMLILFNIMSSLISNEYVRTRHESLPGFIGFGVVICMIFTLVFVIYANRFLIKRRNKEFALYGILGLEKRHIRRIMLFEHAINYSLIAIISIVGGYAFGKGAFLGLNRVIGDKIGNAGNYTFSLNAMMITIGFVLFMFVLVYFINIFAIKNASPMELLSKVKKGEGEPKNKIFTMLLGLSFLAYGYGIAFYINGTLNSVVYFFLATVLVIFATYILFVTFSVFVLKMQKENRGYYYKVRHFLSVSGMLYRMKSGAVGLASVAILSTGVIVALSTTLTIYRGMETVVSTIMPREYELGFRRGFSFEETTQREQQIEDIITNSLGNNLKDFGKVVGIFVPVSKTGNELKIVKREDAFGGQLLYAKFITLDSYNTAYNQKTELAANEILVSANRRDLLKDVDLILADRQYNGKVVEGLVAGNVGVESYTIVLPSKDSLHEMSEFYKILDFQNNQEKYISAPFHISLSFNTDVENAKELIRGQIDDEDLELEVKTELKNNMYELNGGFLFIGIIVGIIFLSGTILIIYYKQLSEGIEDGEKYAIMKRVGLSDEMIKKTTASQVVWLFFLPLIVSGIHSLAASKIIFQLLGLFGVGNYFDYLSMLAVVMLVFCVIYFINFKITSNVYYKHVK